MEEEINEEVLSDEQNVEKISIPINIAETKKSSKVFFFKIVLSKKFF